MSGGVRGVWALRYAYRTESFRGEHFLGHDAECAGRYPIDYFVWAIQRDDDVVLVDAGFTRETAERRGSRNYLGDPAELLAGLGLSAADVSTVVLSHLHYDHTGHVAALPSAQVVLQRRELDFWQSDVSRRGAFDHLVDRDDVAHIAGRADAGTLRLIDGDLDLGGGVSVHGLSGHTPGVQVVRVELSGRAPLVLAADVTHFYENYEADRPYGALHNVAETYLAFDRLTELAGPDGTVVPGHDPLVRHRFTVRDEGGRIVDLLTTNENHE